MLQPLKATSASALALPIVATISSMFFFQTGASLVKQLLPVTGAPGGAALRLGFASLVMLLFWRPWRFALKPGLFRHILPYGITLGVMNLAFYAAINRIPLGIAVALEFTGPLGLALLFSKRRLDLLWVVIAAGGVYLLLPLGANADIKDLSGVGFALLAGLCWALYIYFGQKAGAEAIGATLAYGTLIAALIVVPFGILSSQGTIFEPKILMLGLAVALLSSVIPYSLELLAMVKIPAKTFGILMSLDPAVAALMGYSLLGEQLSWRELTGIALVIAASAASVTANRQAAPVAN